MHGTTEHQTLLVATRNAHKIQEIRAILGPNFRCLALSDFPDAPKVPEDAPTFAGNAIRKAVALARWAADSQAVPADGGAFECGFVLADDSGLEVDVLGGAPGVHSARFAAIDHGGSGNSSDADNNAKLLRLLDGVPGPKRTARFRCVIALAPLPAPTPESASPVCYADEVELSTRTFEGACEGRIATKPSGQGGFGYDPLFIPDGFECSFAELGDEVKNRISHRAKALELLRRALSGR